MKKYQSAKLTSKLHRIVRLSLDHGIMSHSAELSYYLLFSVFPMLIVVNSSMTLLNINAGDIGFLETVMPHTVLNFLEEYTSRSYGSHTYGYLFMGVFLTLLSGSQYIASVRGKLRRICGVSKKRYISERMTAVLYAVVVMLLFFVTLVLSLAGKAFLGFIADYFSITRMFSTTWLVLRFAIIGACAFFVTAGLLRSTFSCEERQHFSYTTASAVVMLLWVICSGAFSFYIDNFADYSVIYGSLGTVIVLLLWLYLTNLVLLLGSVVGVVVREK